jgi:DNA polymerase V
MADLLTLDLVEKKLVTDQIVLTVGYDLENLTDPARRRLYHGPVDRDYYGRGEVPRPAHGSVNLGHFTASTREILEAVAVLFDRIVDPNLLVRRMYVVANHVFPEGQAPEPESEQLDLFSAMETPEPEAKEDPQRERRRQEAILRIREKYGKNAILRGMNLEEGATARDRNQQIGGHRA